MATLKQARIEAEKVGATITRSGSHTISLDVPNGMIIKFSDSHYKDWQANLYPVMSELYDEVIEVIQYGLEPCDTPDCEICNGEEKNN